MVWNNSNFLQGFISPILVLRNFKIIWVFCHLDHVEDLKGFSVCCNILYFFLWKWSEFFRIKKFYFDRYFWKFCLAFLFYKSHFVVGCWGVVLTTTPSLNLKVPLFLIFYISGVRNDKFNIWLWTSSATNERCLNSKYQHFALFYFGLTELIEFIFI